MTQGSNFHHAMKVLGEELVSSSSAPLEECVADRLMTDLGINESEADAYVTAAYDRYYEAYTK